MPSNRKQWIIRINIRISHHAIERFAERIMGLTRKESKKLFNSDSISIAYIIQNLINNGIVCATKEQSIIIQSEWYDEKNILKEVFIFLLLNPKTGGWIVPTIYNKELAQDSKEKEKWHLLKNKKKKKRKKS